MTDKYKEALNLFLEAVECQDPFNEGLNGDSDDLGMSSQDYGRKKMAAAVKMAKALLSSESPT